MFAFYRFLYYNILYYDCRVQRRRKVRGIRLKFIELKKSLVSAPPKPCYIVSGDDAFVVRSAINMFASLAGSMRDLNITVFNKDADCSEIIAALLSPPMLADYRVVVVNDYASELSKIKDYLARPNPTSVLVFSGALTSNFNAIVKLVEPVDCNKLDATYLSGWVVKKAASERATVTREAAVTLVEYCNRDMNVISNELRKLIDYADGDVIGEETVQAMVTPEPDFKVYELSEAIANKNREKAINLAETLLAENNSAVSLIAMLFSHFRRLLFVSLNPASDTLAGDLKVKEYAIKMAVRQAARFTPRRLKAIFDRLNEMDAAVKSGLCVDKTALVTFVCETVSMG